MFLHFPNLYLRADLVVKIEARPKNGDSTNEDWEVVVFYQDERQLNPIGESVWVGSYTTITEGSEDYCQAMILKYRGSLEKAGIDVAYLDYIDSS